MVDLISELGEMAFASRLKRISERLMKDVTRIYKELDIDFEARWFPLLYNLHLEPRMSITELASNLSLTHPAVNQLSAEMEKKGLIISAKDKKDERRRLLRLSAKGKKTVRELRPVWEDIREATGELLRNSGKDILKTLAAIEADLDNREMYERVNRRMIERKITDIEIVSYRPSLKRYFRDLNYQWLEEYFKIERSDEILLNNPQKEIIDKGGAVYFVRLGKETIGTAALIKHENGVLELAKMAVGREYRGFGIGAKLLSHILKEAGNRGNDRLWLMTSARLEYAVKLYNKFGFKDSKENPLGHEQYERCTKIMVRNLDDKA